MKFRKFRENVCARAACGPRGGATVSAVAANTLFYSPMTLPTHLNHRFSGFEFPWPNHSSAVSPDINPFRTRTQMSFGHGVNKSFTASSPTADLVTWAANSIEYELLAGGDSAQKD